LIIFVASFFFLIIENSFGQENDSLAIEQPNDQNQDTLMFNDYSDFSKADSIAPIGFQMQKSPTGAIWRSLVLPGWGQYYVESYWKAPIFAGAAIFMGYRVGYFHSNFTDHSGKVDGLQKELDRLKAEDPNNPMIFEIENRTLPVEKNRREYYRDNRDMSAFYLLGIYALATVDAYVGAHLFDFDVSDDGIAYCLEPGMIFQSVKFKITYKFSIMDIFP
jgi:hypothetical protein